MSDGRDEGITLHQAVALIRELRGELDLARADAEAARRNHLQACETIAAMHAAAVGEVRGPLVGLVEDVAHLRADWLASLRGSEVDKDVGIADQHRKRLLARMAGNIASGIVTCRPPMQVTQPALEHWSREVSNEAVAIARAILDEVGL